jgi:hypothetical protein
VVLLAMQDDDDSREEDEGLVDAVVDGEEVPTHRWGSGCCCVGKAPNIERCCVFYSHLLFNDFWGDSPVYSPTYFKRFFRLPIGHFDEIVTRVVAQDNYFCQKKDASGKLGLSSLQKIYLAVCQLTSGISSIEQDDKYRMAASTGLESYEAFY